MKNVIVGVLWVLLAIFVVVLAVDDSPIEDASEDIRVVRSK